MSARVTPAFLAKTHLAFPLQGWNLAGDTAEPAAEGNDELFTFQEESEDAGRSSLHSQTPWVLLIVDDEQQVHEATTLTLRRGRVAERPFRFLHAHSAAEAREIINAEPQIDLVLLDVVMETRDAGLKLVTQLRGPMGRNDLKILIRSGQPGFENDATVRERYPVDGYMQKTAQTYTLLMEVIGNLLLGTTPDHHSAC
ncbi:response regulator [Uliginosibacterium sp. 31-16]|uniref:response regulator n=1 Tax=Uliginosibacterium sp. 31-16 TaxID=3068315 RepID=UPI00273D21A6|nr:response regulator [Uliginosibacterium sp. 31-16]MDP5241145.1 response regulator [Uliginosibacterium sp. 31-16]